MNTSMRLAVYLMTLNECCVYPQALAEEATASKTELEMGHDEYQYRIGYACDDS